jgi:CRP/FNR family transcriptional regulator, cyclic AMP receptor protein
MPTLEKSELLARHFLFRGLEPTLVRRLVELSITRRLVREQVLFRKGDEGGALYGVLEGAVRIAVVGPSGKKRVLNVMEPGDVFGEIALLDGLPRTAEASAIIPSRLVEIRRRDFLALMEREPKLSTHVLELLCERLRWVSALVEDAVFLPVPARVAKRLLALTVAYGREGLAGTDIELPISQGEIAHMAGASRERVSILLAEWARHDLLSLGWRHITVRNRAVLEQIARGDSPQGPWKP